MTPYQAMLIPRGKLSQAFQEITPFLAGLFIIYTHRKGCLLFCKDVSVLQHTGKLSLLFHHDILEINASRKAESMKTGHNSASTGNLSSEADEGGLPLLMNHLNALPQKVRSGVWTFVRPWRCKTCFPALKYLLLFLLLTRKTFAGKIRGGEFSILSPPLQKCQPSTIAHTNNPETKSEALHLGGCHNLR